MLNTTNPIFVEQKIEEIWARCLQILQTDDKIPEDECLMWLHPLDCLQSDHGIVLLAPNKFVCDWVKERYLVLIQEAFAEYLTDVPEISIKIGDKKTLMGHYFVGSGNGLHRPMQHAPLVHLDQTHKQMLHAIAAEVPVLASMAPLPQKHLSNINPDYNFDTFVEGKSNQLAKAAARQVAENAGGAYNPLFLYGGVGLGKTHLMHAIGNLILQNKPNARVLYLNSERFVADMVKALQNNAMNEFKRFYRGLDALLIDDIQFFSGKDRTQEEFFYTFNALLESQQQIVLTSDRYPKEINGVEERLKSRFGWGLTVAIEPPELETRVAILLSKAEQYNVELPYEVAFFIAKRLRSNVRELEGALKRVRAHAHFSGRLLTVDLAKEALKDLIALQEKLVTIDNIIKTVAEYYKVKVADILSKRRNRSFTRPRQLAMALAKELTNHSLPEIGDAFGGRDHTTVIHAHRKMAELRVQKSDIEEDYVNLMRILTA